MLPESVDVVVVGGGNAALCAALAAAEQGVSVLVLERAPESEAGGNSRFTAGAIRCVYDGVEDLRRLMRDPPEEILAVTDFGQYTEENFFDDMARVTEYRAAPDMVELLVKRSRPTVLWMRAKGVRFEPILGRQAFKVDGRFKFWGGLTVEASGGGPGLVAALTGTALKNHVTIVYRARALSLVTADDGSVIGVRLRHDTRTHEISCKAVVLAAGGFQSNIESRTRYLGPGLDLAQVRGTRYDTCDGIRMALEAGAIPWGNWSGCHAVGWDRNAPPFGDLEVGDNYQKHSYPFGIMLNALGERFVDEGADFRNYTYAKYGRIILNQPAQFAWQIFDRKVLHLLRDEYRMRKVTKVRAATLEELVRKLDDVNAETALATVRAYNSAVEQSIPFNPNIKDGRGTKGLTVPKSNWANTIDEPPFEAYCVTCGITFTFGGVKVNADAQVIDTEGEPIKGLYAAGEMVGGIFYFNYPGGTGLMAGALVGKIADGSAGPTALGPRRSLLSAACVGSN